MTCALHGMWFLNAGYTIPDVSRVDCSSVVTGMIEEALSVEIRNKWLSVSSTGCSTSFKCTAKLAHIYWPLTDQPELTFETGKNR